MVDAAAPSTVILSKRLQRCIRSDRCRVGASATTNSFSPAGLHLHGLRQGSSALAQPVLLQFASRGLG
jgi:hypothetical protein